MALCKIQTLKINVVTFFSLVCFFAAATLFVVGGIFYEKENSKLSIYANITCVVKSSVFDSYVCVHFYSRFPCFVSKWSVRYNNFISTIVGTKRYKTIEQAIIGAKKYKEGASYPCWYSTRDPSVVQWNKPNTQLGIILLSSGGLAAFLTIVFIYLTRRFIIQKYQQTKI